MKVNPLVAIALLSGSCLARPSKLQRRQANTGSCGSPAIEFGLGFDGRTDPSFRPADPSSFSHGSALGIGVITSFICQQLNDKCKAPQATLDACAKGAAAAAAATGQAAADAFNAALGVSVGGGNGGGAAAPPATTKAAATTAAAAAPPATTAASAAAPAAGSLNPFTGSLGAPPVPIVDSGNPDRKFQVNGDTFVNKSAACQRACDVQNNKCANAFNSGDKSIGGVGACNAQQQECNTVCNAGAGNGGGAAATTAAAAVTTAPAAAETTAEAAAPTDCAAAAPPATTVTPPATTACDVVAAISSAATSNGAFDLGECPDPTIIFAPGIDNRKATEFSYQPHNLTQFPHGSALNPAIIAEFICDEFINHCGADQAARDICALAEAGVRAATVRDQKVADDFNAFFNLKINVQATVT